ncbi:MAG: NTP transferase domain-containing protein [Candidatus Aenigmarchaeota archaeon]|nr:NTP transferase domain-containing protein [Candidatus Aenigmarchaeota archaeon]
MQAVILAAGKGERLRPLTETVPKVMLPVANRPILEHNIEKLRGLVDEVILVVGYRKEIIRNHFGNEFLGMKISYAVQKEQLGTGHALLQAKALIKDRFIFMMGDNLYERKDIERCIKHDYSILTRIVENPKIFGICEIEKGLLKDIDEKPAKPKSSLANAALYVLDRKIFGMKMPKTRRGEYEITDAIVSLAKEDDIHAVEASVCEFITYPWDILRVNEYMIKKHGGRIDPAAKIDRSARIDKNVIIGKNAEIKNAVIRPYTVIGDNAVIGNFVEIKNSIIMEGTKIPHLSYVGDSVIGRNCNFGAGTKIANLRFDDSAVKMEIKGKAVDTGRRKLGCIMGDNVRTGINSSIMPGAMIKPGSFLSAGKVHKQI